MLDKNVLVHTRINLGNKVALGNKVVLRNKF